MAPVLSKCVRSTLRAEVHISDLKQRPDTSHLLPNISRYDRMKAWSLYDDRVTAEVLSLTQWDGLRRITVEGVKKTFKSMLVCVHTHFIARHQYRRRESMVTCI